MHRLLSSAAVIALALASYPAQAAEGQRLSLTVYNSNLALVQDIRALDIGAGRQKLEFKDVSAQIRPETVSLTGRGLSVVEQNFDYDLLTPAKMMEKAVGKQVQIVRTNPGTGKETTETATVLSVNDGVVLRIGDRIEVLRDDGVPTRVIFDGIPENLRARPTLSVTVDADGAGRRDTTLTYLTHGLSWKADYVALFDEKSARMDLQGWVTLTNGSGVTYANADTQLVAGDINLTSSPQEYWMREQQRGNTRQAGMETGAAPGLGDYYLYPLPERVSVAQNQTKQVGFVDAKGVSARKAYLHEVRWFQSSDQPTNADVVLQFANARAAGAGLPLPAGVVRVYMRDASGEPKFVGENTISHTPQGSEISIKTGEAFDVTVQPTVVSQDRAARNRSRYSMSYLFRNARSEPVTVDFRQGGLWRDGKVVTESLKSERIDAYRLGWKVPVPAGGETTLTFTVDTGW